MSLVAKDAAILVKDVKAQELLIDKAYELCDNGKAISELEKNIKQFAFPDSANVIAGEVLKLIK
jgi:UDP-N-acetylglucosamine--N-acetylmuramyl-(pentapeptide) pyrophosphoryl-undecaprenol N-acetylglucosamine transferase